MTNIYATQQQTQAQSYIQQGVFYNDVVTEQPKELNWFEKHKLMKSLAAKLLRGHGVCVVYILDYLLMNANNKTGICYHSQESMKEATGYSKSQIIRSIQVLEQKGFIYKIRRGRNVTNIYTLNFDIINGVQLSVRKKPPIMELYPCRPDKTCAPLEVSSNDTRTTNTEERVSINTRDTNFLNEKIEIQESWQPDSLTQDLLKTHLGVTEQFIENETKGFVSSIMEEKNKLHKQSKSIAEWNRIFYGHCKRTLSHHSAKAPSKRIPQYKRLDYHNSNKFKSDTSQQYVNIEQVKQCLLMLFHRTGYRDHVTCRKYNIPIEIYDKGA